ncbi:MAG: hypothetical protein Q4G22_13840 [Paracoccus sp. (in: a-proteobacteria)]|uniref:hypothetical protein n=1 Tax=Paracoccus sp. TaxID=267 RepID=UPI0026DEE773|nr:hypothetical protein [Paracoccus sp. (in: a-proteobacteria)]MDO5632899.1 hypothetical protein [Paracoccus sp. (in: a-proteobacteria)]
MPLPHFLLMIAIVILLAAVTLWASVAAGIPLAALAIVALMGAAVLHLSMRDHEG